MQESIHKYFKIGTIQWMSHPLSAYSLLAKGQAEKVVVSTPLRLAKEMGL